MSTLSTLQHAIFACKHTQEAILTSSVPKHLLFLLELHFESYIDNKARLLWALNYMPKGHWYLYCQLTSQNLFISLCLSLQGHSMSINCALSQQENHCTKKRWFSCTTGSFTFSSYWYIYRGLMIESGYKYLHFIQAGILPAFKSPCVEEYS